MNVNRLPKEEQREESTAPPPADIEGVEVDLTIESVQIGNLQTGETHQVNLTGEMKEQITELIKMFGVMVKDECPRPDHHIRQMSIDELRSGKRPTYLFRDGREAQPHESACLRLFDELYAHTRVVFQRDDDDAVHVVTKVQKVLVERERAGSRMSVDACEALILKFREAITSGRSYDLTFLEKGLDQAGNQN